ncbi:hypothetical protein [Streptomyces sp. NBC_01089]|uniref:hypothetical protein n=1 Tax=Streptomyces sp. NBC_01089 TaxID=2903747 RepID=UPI00386D798E|nr:hypothetical protein OG510_08345 [Streptomyces sp. NBC_01089]
MPHWADWEMRAITRMGMQSWIRSLIEKGAGASAIKRAYNLTFSIMRAAVDDDVIAVSPCRSTAHSSQFLSSVAAGASSVRAWAARREARR